jgi:antirestriction protein
MSDCRIYVACLASYNAGCLHGAWIDCTDLDSMQDQVNAILRASPEPNVFVTCPDCNGTKEKVLGHNSETGETRVGPCETCKGRGTVPSSEEFAIHDHEGFGGLIEEYTSLTRVAALAEAIEEHGAAFIAFMENRGNADDIGETVEAFTDAYRGEWDSEQKFAENLLDELGEIKGDSLAERYFDYEAFTRDLFISDYWRDEDTGAVFANY